MLKRKKKTLGKHMHDADAITPSDVLVPMSLQPYVVDL